MSYLFSLSIPSVVCAQGYENSIDLIKSKSLERKDEYQRSLSFTVLSQQGQLEQFAEVKCFGDDRVSVHFSSHSESMFLVKNGSGYFIKTEKGVRDIHDKGLISQLDFYLSLTNFYNAIDLETPSLTASEVEVDNEFYWAVRQGEDREILIHQKSYLPYRVHHVFYLKGEPYSGVSTIKEYIKVAGVDMPSIVETIHSTSDGEFKYVHMLSNFRFDQSFPEELFKAVRVNK